MIKITPELVEKVEQYYDIKGLTDKPFWKDECNHAPESYICSFIIERIHDKNVFETKFDLYIFNQPYYGQEICLRDGNEPKDYCSPGSVTDYMIHYGNASGLRRNIASLLRHIGRIKWEQYTS